MKKKDFSFPSHMKRDVYTDIRPPISVSALRLAGKRTLNFHCGQKTFLLMSDVRFCAFSDNLAHMSAITRSYALSSHVFFLFMQIAKNDRRSWRDAH